MITVPSMLLLLKIFTVALAFYGGIRLVADRNEREKRLSILWVLEREHDKGMTGVELHTITGVSLGSIYPMLARLEDEGLVLRRIDEVTRRHRFYINLEKTLTMLAEWEREHQ